MNYKYTFIPSCEKEIDKSTRKNPILKKILNNKINEIIENPYHYKPLSYDFAGERRVHIIKNQILKFRIDEQNKTIIFIFFGHHNDAYKR
ncbi:MAG: type II toxin-antitoxin system RelE/ParE family toxin [Nanoarchaeota archaeon]|nr:type II toxin-antitoxin system RelE/ParE family toxin [Nanoarchaeota archaeon]